MKKTATRFVITNFELASQRAGLPAAGDALV